MCTFILFYYVITKYPNAYLEHFLILLFRDIYAKYNLSIIKISQFLEHYLIKSFLFMFRRWNITFLKWQKFAISVNYFQNKHLWISSVSKIQNPVFSISKMNWSKICRTLPIMLEYCSGISTRRLFESFWQLFRIYC